MAIAPVLDRDPAYETWTESPWPRPVLHVVPGHGADPAHEATTWSNAPAWGAASTGGRDRGDVTARVGVDVAVRRRRREAVRARRRRLALATAAVGLTAALSLPVSALAGRREHTPAGMPGAGTSKEYVVRPGDTLRSISARLDPAHAGRLAAELAKETGSTSVVSGEHLRVP